MKKLILALVAAASLSGAANAATYNVTVIPQPFRSPGVDGLQTRAFTVLPAGPQTNIKPKVKFDLINIGDVANRDIFGLVHFDAPLQPDDTIPQTGTVAFDFGAGIGVLNLVITTFARVATQDALATFTSGLIRVAPATGIQVTVADTVFGSDGANFVNNRPGIGIVNAQFTLAAIPVPAALPLSLTALGLMAFVARRKSRKATAA